MKMNAPMMNCCYPMMDAPDPKMTARRNYEMDSDRPQLIDDARLETGNQSGQVPDGLSFRQPL